MIYIFDFDYTLFDTVKFRDSLPEAFGISEKEYKDSYKKYYTVPKIHYNAYGHLSHLAKNGRINDMRQAKKNMLATLKKIDEFLFSGVENLLARIKKNASSVILITRGDMVWQKMKMKHLKIKKYFDRIIITDKEKALSLDPFKKGKERIAIINDNARECESLKKAFGIKSKIFLIKGPYSSNIKHRMKVYELDGLLRL